MDQNPGRVFRSERLVRPQTSFDPHCLITTSICIRRTKLNEKCGYQRNDKDSHLAPYELVVWRLPAWELKASYSCRGVWVNAFQFDQVPTPSLLLLNAEKVHISSN